LKSYFESNNVRCLPADKVIDVPLGDWRFFARNSDGSTSAWPGVVRVREDLNAYKGIQFVRENDSAAIAALSCASAPKKGLRSSTPFEVCHRRAATSSRMGHNAKASFARR
jgi:hypothetical protein